MKYKRRRHAKSTPEQLRNILLNGHKAEQPIDEHTIQLRAGIEAFREMLEARSPPIQFLPPTPPALLWSVPRPWKHRRLSVSDVNQILTDSTISAKSLAKMLGVSCTTIERVRAGQIYQYLVHKVA